MILPILYLVLCGTLVQSLEEGASCSLKNGNPGVCALASKCQSIAEQLKAGNVSDTICKNSGSRVDPVVCCPSSTSAKSNTDGRGAIARQKCAEYSQSVFVPKELRTLDGHLQPTNVSQCAIVNVQSFVEPTSRVQPGEFPHVAAVGFNSEDGDIRWICGGTLISEIFVLTAAHCTSVPALGDAAWVRVGDVDLTESVDDGAKPEDRRIAQRIRHPDYKPPAQYHDIGLLRLESPVPFNRWIRPACLPSASLTRTRKVIIAPAWRREEWINDDSQTYLTKNRLMILDTETCNANRSSSISNVHFPDGVIGDWTICTSTGEKNSFMGKTGGPLVIYSKPEYHCMYDVVGVASLQILTRSLGIYTRVYNYIPWIESVVWGEG